jgi:hypothetical protein
LDEIAWPGTFWVLPKVDDIGRRERRLIEHMVETASRCSRKILVYRLNISNTRRNKWKQWCLQRKSHICINIAEKIHMIPWERWEWQDLENEWMNFLSIELIARIQRVSGELSESELERERVNCFGQLFQISRCISRVEPVDLIL